jgi:hypothetical protein
LPLQGGSRLSPAPFSRSRSRPSSTRSRATHPASTAC